MSDMTPMNRTCTAGMPGEHRARAGVVRRPTYKVPQRDPAADEPEEHNEAGHAEDEQPCSARIEICTTISKA